MQVRHFILASLCNMFFIGVAAGIYFTVEACFPQLDPHNRGIWEGMMIISIIDAGTLFSKRFIQRAVWRE